jgi:hypothetical protein
VRTVNTVSKRWADLGLAEGQAERAREAVDEVLAGGGRASRVELLAAMAAGGVDVSGQRGYHLIGYLALTGTLCLGPTDGQREQLYVRLDDWVPDRRLDRDEALAELALRFFTGHGPATVPDLARWAGSTLRDVRAGLSAVRDRLESVSVDGTEYFMAPDTPDRLAAARTEAEGVLLLPGFDEFVLGYGDRTAVVPAEFANRIVPGGNGMFRATVVHGGQVVAAWKWTGSGANRAPAVEPFRDLPGHVAEAIPRLAADLP